MGGPIFCASFSPDGKSVALAGDNGQAQIWVLEDLPLSGSKWSFARVLFGHDPAREVTWIDYSTDGSKLVTASADGTAKIWDTAGNLLATLGPYDGEAAWEVLFAEFDGSGYVLTTVADPDSDDLDEGFERGGAVHSWNVADGTHVVRIDAPGVVSARLDRSHSLAIATVAAHGVPAGDDVTVGWTETVYVHDASRKDPPVVVLTDANSGINSVDFSRAGALVVASEAGGATIYQQQPAGSWSPSNTTGQTSDASEYAEFHPTEDYAVYVGSQGVIRFLGADPAATAPQDIDEGLPGVGSDRWINAVRFSSDGASVVAANENGTAEIWPVAGGTAPVILGQPIYFAVSPTVAWQDTGVDVSPDAPVSITYYAGKWTSNPGTVQDVDGAGDANHTAGAKYALEGSPEGALVGAVVGEDDPNPGNAGPFLVGNSKSGVGADKAGRLYLCINDDHDASHGKGLTDNTGFIVVTIDQPAPVPALS